MTRRKKLMLNSTMSLLYQLIALICGFVLPRIFLTTYGSAVNGLVSSITQFLGFIALCEMGIGAVIQSTLYKPLADNDTESISKIALSSERFFRKIAYILVLYTVMLMIAYPFITAENFEYGYTSLLILVMSISTFAQYYFGMTYRLMLSADQLGFIHFSVSSVALILNTSLSILLMHLGASIHAVKLTTSIIFLIQPLCMALIAKRRYKIDRSIVLTEEPIKQKWNGVAQHIAAVVLGNTDTVVLTLMSTLENVSIYAVYHLVVNGVKQILLSLTNGVQAMFGNMLAKKENDNLTRTFELFEWIMHTGVTLAFSITAFLIVQFVSVYTNGITDVNYIVPLFACLICLAEAMYCLRLPYNIMVLAAGHYKQTQASAFIEASINIVVSVATVLRFGLVGVAIGTLAAMLYRTCYLAWYLRRNIINHRFSCYLKHMLIDIISVIAFTCVIKLVPGLYSLENLSYVSWFVLAVKVGVTCVTISCVINLLFYRTLILEAIKGVKNRVKKCVIKKQIKR